MSTLTNNIILEDDIAKEVASLESQFKRKTSANALRALTTLSSLQINRVVLTHLSRHLVKTDIWFPQVSVDFTRYLKKSNQIDAGYRTAPMFVATIKYDVLCQLLGYTFDDIINQFNQQLTTRQMSTYRKSMAATSYRFTTIVMYHLITGRTMTFDEYMRCASVHAKGDLHFELYMLKILYEKEELTQHQQNIFRLLANDDTQVTTLETVFLFIALSLIDLEMSKRLFDEVKFAIKKYQHSTFEISRVSITLDKFLSESLSTLLLLMLSDLTDREIRNEFNRKHLVYTHQMTKGVINKLLSRFLACRQDRKDKTQ